MDVTVLLFTLGVLGHTHCSAVTSNLSSNLSSPTPWLTLTVGQLMTLQDESLSLLNTSKLPSWMYLEKLKGSGRHLVGVPLSSDAGYHQLPSPASHITVHVLSNSPADYHGCHRQRPTLAIVTVDTDINMLSAVDRVALVRGVQKHLHLSRKAAGSLRLLHTTGGVSPAGVVGINIAQESMFVLASGPGNSAISKTSTSQLRWTVGCGAIDKSSLHSLEILEKAAVTGALSAGIRGSPPVISWLVADRRPALTSSRRLRRSVLGEGSGDGDGQLEGSGMGERLPIKIQAPPTTARPFWVATTTATTLKPATTTITTTTTTIGPTTTTRSYIPRLVEGVRLGSLQCTVGLTSKYAIPNDAFHDQEDGRTNQLRLRFDRCSQYRWLMMDSSSNHIARCVNPPERAQGRIKCILVVTDSDGNFLNTPFYVDVAPPKYPVSIVSETPIIATVLKGTSFNKTLDYRDYFTDVYSSKKQPLRLFLGLTTKKFQRFDDSNRLFPSSDVESGAELPPSMYAHFNPDTAELSAYPLAELAAGRYTLSLRATNKFDRSKEIDVKLVVKDEVLLGEATHVFDLVVKTPWPLEGEVLRLRQLAAVLQQLLGGLRVRLLEVRLIIVEARRRRRQAKKSNQPHDYFTQVKFDTPELHRPTCQAHTLRRTRDRFFVTDALCRRRPTPHFANMMGDFQPRNMSVQSEGSCKTAGVNLDFPCWISTTTLPPTTVTTTTLPPLPTRPAVTNSAPVVNLAVDSAGNKYCFRPFVIREGIMFRKVIQRLDCVVDKEDGNLRNLVVVLRPYEPTADKSILSDKNSWIFYNKKYRSFEGMPLKEHVGNHKFSLVVADRGGVDPATGMKLEVKSVTVKLHVEVDEVDDAFYFHKVRMHVRSYLGGQRNLAARLYAEKLAALVAEPGQPAKVDDIYIGSMNFDRGKKLTTLEWAWRAVNKQKYSKCPIKLLAKLFNKVRGQEMREIFSGMMLQRAVVLRKNDCKLHDWSFILNENSSPSFTTASVFYTTTSPAHSSSVRDKIVPLNEQNTNAVTNGDNNNNNIVSNNDNNNIDGNSGNTGSGSPTYGRPNQENPDPGLGTDTDKSKSDKKKKQHDLLTTMVPACALIVTALAVALTVACCLQQKRRRQQQNRQNGANMSSTGPTHTPYGQFPRGYDLAGGVGGKAGVPIIFAEELEERPMAPSKPLILPDEKPPLPPPDYAMEPEEPLLGGGGTLRNGHSTFSRGQNHHQQQQQQSLQQAPTVRVYMPS